MRQFKIRSKMIDGDLITDHTVTSVYQWVMSSRFIYGSRIQILTVTEVR